MINKKQTSFYTEEELQELGFKSIGKKNVLISRKASIYNASNIDIGNNVRIDDFCILSGKIEIGSHIHIAAGVYMFAGDAGIQMEDFTNISSRSALYASNDDYSGNSLIGPTIPDDFRNISNKKIIMKKHSILGIGVTILPGVIIEEGTAVGTMSFLMKSTLPWKVYFGIPAKPIKSRSKDIVLLEENFLKKNNEK
jgi:acetyltransferase-like isoleucine patch superfamily enzyme